MQQRSEETRSQIIQSAIKLFVTHGFTAASVDMICRDADVSKGAFYHHFPSKQALFLALLDMWLTNIDKSIDSSRNNTVPETFLQIAEGYPYVIRTASQGLTMFLEFWLQASRDPKIWSVSITPYHRYHQYFTALIQKGVDEGSFVEVDAETASRLIVSTAMGLLLQSLLDPQGADWENVARQSSGMLVNILMKK